MALTFYADTNCDVRRLVIEDAKEVLAVLMKSTELVGWDIPPVQSDYALNSCHEIISGGWSLGAFIDGRLVGVLFILECTWFWNGDASFLRNENFFVLPEYRKTRAASKLIKSAKQLAKGAGKPLFLMLNFGGDKRTDDFIERQGFRRLGGNFQMKD